ncbi:MAG: hypothetical protein KA383_10200 [Phycisphaerae bacterium]|nr:hypothetical protein [Phycisphaerae bacterium]
MALTITRAMIARPTAITGRTDVTPQTLRALLAAGRKLDETDPAVVRQTAAQFLSELFFKPLLAEAREFPLGRDFADGGQTESTFGAKLDERFADGIATASSGLVRQMTRYFGAVPPPAASDARRVSWTTQTQLAPRAEVPAA